MPLVRARVPNVRLIIAGKGDAITDYTDVVDDLSNIEIRNRFIPRSEAAQLFVEADLLVLPYIQASQSGPLIIAMAFGLPVVATDVGDITSVVRSIGMGLIVPPRDSYALAEAISKAALDENLRKLFSERAKEAIGGEYSRKEIGTRTLLLYQELRMKQTRV
jgi:glycosyltransferase involved in cell wall biosynthesis